MKLFTCTHCGQQLYFENVIQARPPDWQENVISSYAAMHPREDWAETWAHYLHRVDTPETAWQSGIGILPKTGDDAPEPVRHDFDSYWTDHN